MQSALFTRKWIPWWALLLVGSCGGEHHHNSETDGGTNRDGSGSDAQAADSAPATGDGGTKRDAARVLDASPDDDGGNSGICGNRVIENGEQCDGDTRVCTLQGTPGIQACNLNCNGYNACIPSALPPSGSPYPPSPVISSITFDRSTLQRAAEGSDQFGYTTASDGNIYVGWGDGGGFGGSNSLGRVSMGVARIEGIPPNWTAHNVWGGLDPESNQQPTLGKTSNGVVAVNGAIYLYIVEQDVWTNNHLWKSTDLAMSWSDLGPMFDESDASFADPGILQFGPDYQGARDTYVYGYSEEPFETGLALFRVPTAQIETRSSYEFFSGLDSSQDPTWSSDISEMQPVFTDPNGTEWGVTCTYDPYLRRYLLAVRHNGDAGDWGLFDAPDPWGPWTTVGYGTDFPEWTYSPDPNGASANRPAYLHNFPSQWMGPDLVTLWHISDRGDQFNIMKATLTLVGP